MTSKFAGLKEMRERRSQQDQPSAQEPVGEKLDTLSAPTLPATATPGVTPVPDRATAPVLVPKKMGRPPGKRSNPDYQQVTVLLHSATYTETRKRLLDERKEVSELLNELLDAWLKI